MLLLSLTGSNARPEERVRRNVPDCGTGMYDSYESRCQELYTRGECTFEKYYAFLLNIALNSYKLLMHLFLVKRKHKPFNRINIFILTLSEFIIPYR